MASATDLAELNRLGAVLERLGHDNLTLTFSREDGRVIFYADVADPNGKFQCAMGGTASDAFVAAEAKLARAGRTVAHA